MNIEDIIKAEAEKNAIANWGKENSEPNSEHHFQYCSSVIDFKRGAEAAITALTTPKEKKPLKKDWGQLKENECVQCHTEQDLKDFCYMIGMPLHSVRWDTYKGNTCIWPLDGTWESMDHANLLRHTIHNASDYLSPLPANHYPSAVEVGEVKIQTWKSKLLDESKPMFVDLLNSCLPYILDKRDNSPNAEERTKYEHYSDVLKELMDAILHNTQHAKSYILTHPTPPVTWIDWEKAKDDLYPIIAGMSWATITEQEGINQMLDYFKQYLRQHIGTGDDN